jgi:hypothetical protein
MPDTSFSLHNACGRPRRRHPTAQQAGSATKVVANGGAPVETVPAAAIPVAIYGTDHEDNPGSSTRSARARR